MPKPAKALQEPSMAKEAKEAPKGVDDPVVPAVAANPIKEPPPESAEAVRTRSWVIFSFWAVVIFFGLPIWWRTTSIYRANLPLQEMMEWSEGKACRPIFPLQITIEAPFLQDQEAQHLLRTTQHTLDDLNDFSAHHLRLRLSQNSNASTSIFDESLKGDMVPLKGDGRDVALTVRLIPGDSGTTPYATIQPYSPILDVYYTLNQIRSSSSGSSPLASFIAAQLQEIFAEEQAMIAYNLSAATVSPSTQSSGSSGQSTQHSSVTAANGRESRSTETKSLSPELAESLARRTTRSLKYTPTYHLTFSLFTPNSAPSSWEIEAALEEYLLPLLESLSPLCNFTIDSQVQLFASFSPSVQTPSYSPSESLWKLRREDLSGFINAAEWPLSPSIGGAPTVNFIVFVPAQSQTPLVVADTNATSWLIPQWGGVTILNLPPSHTITATQLRSALLTFSAQLLSLLGTPHTPASLPLRILTLIRVRAASLLISASSTLSSLARVSLALPSISIPRSVAASVDVSLTHLRSACAELREGHFHSAMAHARTANAEAERGFFEKSMVGQLYFPDEHKVAVYLPLLGPVGVPLLMAAVKEVRRLRGWWRARGRGVAGVAGG
ncbi:MAG: GPI transamidase component [Trizodia sp. TS-e1964]|nr:MAG: GPI transamidase component [Trizodia sp. TS-e1964]